jgi:hypothetical protein
MQNARAVAAQGDLRGARMMLEQAVEAAGETLGPDHPEVLAATRMLAAVNVELGDLSDARRLLEEGLADGQFTLGEDHPVLLRMSFDLAILADELGNRHEARRNYTRLARYGPTVLGTEHPFVLAATRYLGEEAMPEGARIYEPEPAPAYQPPPARPRHSAEDDDDDPETTHTVSDVPDWGGVYKVDYEPEPDVYRPEGDDNPPRPARPTWEAAPEAPEERGSRIRPAVLAVAVAILLVGAAVASVVAFRDSGSGSTAVASPSAAGPTVPASPSGAPAGGPIDLRLRDNGSSITLTWIDPTDGAVPFVVAGGRADQGYNPLQSLSSGHTSYTLNGLNASAEYCFLVAAVYSGDRTVPSNPVCTHRHPSPSPNGSR